MLDADCYGRVARPIAAQQSHQDAHDSKTGLPQAASEHEALEWSREGLEA